MKYRREIDGLRALAVIPVILFHSGLNYFSGGFVGVDIFFVISGFLITKIIIEDLSTGNFSISGFYERRARRILPALVFVILFCMPFAWFILTPYDFKEFSQSIFAASIFVSNVFFYFKSGYFDARSELKPLIHTWSLSVEEQFYLFFPILLILLWRVGRERIFRLLVLFTAVSLLLCEFGWRKDPSANFYMIPTRAWELFSGSIVAFICQKEILKPSNALSIIGFSGIFLSVSLFSHVTPYPSLFTLLPVFSAALIILYANQETLIGRILSSKALVGIGLISYSAYLWHQPILAFYRLYYFDDPTVSVTLIILAVTLIAAAVTWRLIEVPARYVKFKNGRRMVLGSSVVVLVLLASLGLLGHVKLGFPDRNPDLQRLAQNGGLSFKCSGAPINSSFCRSVENPKIAIWGDSFAMHFVEAIVEAYPAHGVIQMTLSSCPPVPGSSKVLPQPGISCLDYNDLVSKYLLDKQSHKIETVIISSTDDLVSPIYLSDFSKNIHGLKSLGYRIVLVSPTPRFSNSEKCVSQAMRGQVSLDSCKFSFSQASNKHIFSELYDFASANNIDYVNLKDFICDNDLCSLEKDGKLVLRDRGHLSNEIQSTLAKVFAELSL